MPPEPPQSRQKAQIHEPSNTKGAKTALSRIPPNQKASFGCLFFRTCLLFVCFGHMKRREADPRHRYGKQFAEAASVSPLMSPSRAISPMAPVPGLCSGWLASRTVAHQKTRGTTRHENVSGVATNITTPCRPARICRHHRRCTCACPGRAAGNRRARRTWASARAVIL